MYDLLEKEFGADRYSCSSSWGHLPMQAAREFRDPLWWLDRWMSANIRARLQPGADHQSRTWQLHARRTLTSINSHSAHGQGSLELPTKMLDFEGNFAWKHSHSQCLRRCFSLLLSLWGRRRWPDVQLKGEARTNDKRVGSDGDLLR